MVICWDEGLSSQDCPRGIAREILLILLYCNGLLFAPIFFLICVRFCVLHSVTSAHEAVGKDDECKSQPNFRYWRYAINTLDGNHQDKWEVLSLCRAPPQHWSVGFVPLLTCFLGHFLLQEALCSRNDLLTASSVLPSRVVEKEPHPQFLPTLSHYTSPPPTGFCSSFQGIEEVVSFTYVPFGSEVSWASWEHCRMPVGPFIIVLAVWAVPLMFLMGLCTGLQAGASGMWSCNSVLSEESVHLIYFLQQKETLNRVF